MNKIELKKKLEEQRVKKAYYALEEPYPNDSCLCLRIDEGINEVFHTERGSVGWSKLFDTEEGACSYFYKMSECLPKG